MHAAQRPSARSRPSKTPSAMTSPGLVSWLGRPRAISAAATGAPRCSDGSVHELGIRGEADPYGTATGCSPA